MPFLVDGYNVYHAARKVSEDWAHITPMTLCRLIAEDMRCLREGAVVVFDGRPLRGASEQVEPAGFVKIIFAGPSSDADTALEELIQQNTAPRRLAVVSSDNRIRRAARRRRAQSLSSLEYLQKLQQRRDRPPKRPGEPAEKRRGLSEDEMREWLEMFGLDPDKPTDDTDRIKF